MSAPKITQTRGAFSLVCGVAVNIRANADRIWSLLTDAKDFPRHEGGGEAEVLFSSR